MFLSIPFFFSIIFPLAADAWLPTSPPPGTTLSTFAATSKIRGVNLGSQFIIEPWMARDEWAAMGCGQTKAEFQCIKQAYGGDVNKASEVWKRHWASWITNADLDDMVKAGLNTVRVSVSPVPCLYVLYAFRWWMGVWTQLTGFANGAQIPVGWWMKEDLVKSGEYFPKGGFAYLQSLCQHAANNGMYVIIGQWAFYGTKERDLANCIQRCTGPPERRTPTSLSLVMYVMSILRQIEV